MNEIECETCIKRKTVYCPNHVDCYDTINKPYYQNRIMLLEENKKLKEQLQQKEDIINKAKEKNKQIIKDTKSFYRPTSDRIYSGDCLIEFATENIEILDNKGE